MRKGPTKTEEYRKMIQAEGYHLFDNEIKHRKDVSDSMGVGEKTNNGEYKDLATEILNRINMLAFKQKKVRRKVRR